MGSYSKFDQVPARLTSGWYALPKNWRDRPLLTMSVAGEYDNPNVMLEYTADPIRPDTTDAT